jgi:hypothetical protein
MDLYAMDLPIRNLLGRRRSAAIAVSVCLAASTASAAAVDLSCPGMPPDVAADLENRVSARLADAGVTRGPIRLECTTSGVWITWFDGSRAMVDQGSGIVAGTLALIDGRIAQDREAAQRAGSPVPAPLPPPPEVAPPAPGPGPTPSPSAPAMPPLGTEGPADEHEIPPPGEEDGLTEGILPGTTPGRHRGPEGGLGLAWMTEIWTETGSMGTGPRLDVSVGPPGPFAILIGEGAIFGVGEQAQMLMLDFQAGLAVGAPFKSRQGLGAVLLFGAERMAATGASSDVTGASKWTGIFDLGARASLAFNDTNVWLGADGILRTSDFETGNPNPVHVTSASFMLSLGCFLPAMGHASQ